MNKRIRKLIEQAFIITTDGKIGHVNNYMAEQFAELLIKECAQQAYDLADVLSMHRDRSGAEIAESIGNTIKKHFGVEE